MLRRLKERCWSRVLEGARQHVERLIRVRQLSHCVSILPTVDRKELARIMSKSLIGVSMVKRIKSLDCALPTKLFEYLACGIPFVGYGGTAMREFASQSGAGILAENDSRSIVATITSLLDSPPRMQEMGDRGREFIENHYDRGQIATQVLAEIMSIGGHGK